MALGGLGLAFLVIPYYVVIDAGSLAAFRASPPAEGAAFLAGLNPVFVVATCVFVLLALFGAMAAGYRVRGLLLIGIGMIVTALGGLPMLVAPSLWGAVATSFGVMAAGEALVGGALLARVTSGHHWRAKACFAAAALTAVLLASLPSFVIYALPREQHAVANSVLLAAAVGTTGLIGIALVAAHRTLSRFFWSETA